MGALRKFVRTGRPQDQGAYRQSGRAAESAKAPAPCRALDRGEWRGAGHRGDQEIPLKPGQSVDVPRGAVHRIMNPGDIPLVLVEVQMGDYFGEDDIIRTGGRL